MAATLKNEFPVVIEADSGVGAVELLLRHQKAPS
jgi:hypothetical protein